MSSAELFREVLQQQLKGRDPPASIRHYLETGIVPPWPVVEQLATTLNVPVEVFAHCEDVQDAPKFICVQFVISDKLTRQENTDDLTRQQSRVLAQTLRRLSRLAAKGFQEEILCAETAEARLEHGMPLDDSLILLPFSAEDGTKLKKMISELKRVQHLVVDIKRTDPVVASPNSSMPAIEQYKPWEPGKNDPVPIQQHLRPKRRRR